MIKKGLAVLLMVLMVTDMIPPFVALGATNDKDLYQGISAQISYTAIRDELPAGTPQYNSKGLPINTELWQDKRLVVYGDYSTVNYGSANVKYYHEDDPDKLESFYFRDKEGKKCEYRYLGYTREGNKFPNPKFPADFRTDVPPEDITWYSYPWELKKHYMKNPGYVNQSILDRKPGSEKAEEYINESLDWYIHRAINGKTKQRLSYTDMIKLDKYHFFNVDSPPSSLAPGRGRMINHSYSKGKDYYWTFSIPQVESKNHTPIEPQCNILNKEELFFDNAEKTKIAEVEVVGVLKDEAYYDNVARGMYSGSEVDEYERSINYCREDIENWNIALNAPGGQALKAVGKSNFGPNGIRQVFYVELSREYIESGQVEFHASMFINYYTKEKSPTVTASDNANITKRAAVLSVFNISSILTLENLGAYKSTDINYQDFSAGDIKKYEWKVVNLTTGQEHDFSSPIAIPSNVEKEIYNFSKPFLQKMIDLGDTAEVGYLFKVHQTVSNNLGQSNTATRELSISLGDFSPPAIVIPDFNLPDKAIDMVKYKPRSDTDTSEAKSISITVDGKAVDYDYFFSGNYTFKDSIGLLGINNKLVRVDIRFVSIDDVESHFTTWIYVYTSKPRLDYSIGGTLKVNRRIDLTNESESINDEYVTSKYPITYTWDIKAIEGDNSNLRMRAGTINNPMKKTFLYKEEGVYRFTLNGHNTLRAGDPYYIDIPVFKDYEPAVIFNIWNNVLARNDELHIYKEGISLEEDIITSRSLKILRDDNDDGVYETEIKNYPDAKDYEGYIPTQLGSYQLVYEVHEDFGQETLAEFIKAEDKKFVIEKREFEVENLSPMTKMYVDIPLNFPEADVYLLTDPNLNLNKAGEIKGKKIDLVNDLRQNSIVPDVHIWDLRTHKYTKEVTKSKNTGSSRPPSSISYSSGGYTGTLSRYKTVDDDYKVDRGKYVTKTLSKTVSKTKTSTAWTKYNQQGYPTSSYSPSTPSISYNSGGYKGKLRKTGYKLKSTSYTYWPNGKKKKKTKKYTGYYSGTVKKTTRVWESKWVTKHDYTGYYRGNVSKNIKQPFTNIFGSTTDKYIVYIADRSVTGQSDLNMLRNMSDSKIIYSSPLTNKSNVDHDYFIEYNSDIDSIMEDAMQIIKDENPYELQYTLLKNETLNIRFEDSDAEDDPLSAHNYQVVHDPAVFDNNTGLASFAVSNYAESNYKDIAGSQLNLNFSNKGHYVIYRRITDSPAGHADKALDSNEPKIEVLVHEKPIADFDFEWIYNYSTREYDTTWVDKSYDPDFETIRPDKGIADRKIRFRRNGGQWLYYVPGTIGLGSYQLEYQVKDIFGVWSDVKSYNFTLSANPPVNIEYTINYMSDGEVFFSETIADTMRGVSQTSRTFYARNFEPIYSLNDSSSKTGTVSYVHPSTTISFNYDFNATTNVDVDITLSGERLRPGNVISAGYGIEVDAQVDITTGYSTALLKGTPQMEVVWLEDKPYEWTSGKTYQISNIYAMEWINGTIDHAEFKLQPNPDSNILARKFYTPVQLIDGEYDCLVRFYGVKYPTWYINSSGNVVQGADQELTYEKTFKITIDGTMYDDFLTHN